tara:strand:- start:132 stop:1895 length:1764 start_codon:yes stop_codon:yes gene_type:complete
MTDNINIGGISRMHTSPELSGLVDGIDFPHSGLFKSLSSAVQGNYAIINSATSTTTNFGITQTGTSTTTLNVSTGQVMRDGKLMPAVTLASTPFVVGAQDASNIAHFDYRSAAKGGGNSYYLLVVDASNVIQMRHNGAPPDGPESNVVDIIPQLTAGDIPIAVVRLAETDAVTGRLIQYLTTAKEENSVSIGYNDTGYTESNLISATASGLTISGIATATATSSDKILIQDGSDIIKTITVQNVANFTKTEDNDGDTKIQFEENADEDKIRFDTAGVERMIIDETGNVGIGTDTPLAPLHIISTDDGTTLLLESTDSDDDLAPDLVFKRTSSTPVTGDNLGSIRFLGMNINDESGGTVAAEHEFADIYARGNDLTTGTEDGELYFRTLINGTQRRRLDLTPIRTVFNEDGQDIDFRIESSSEANMFVVDAALNKVGIGTATPNSTLEVIGEITANKISAGANKRGLVSKDSADMQYDISATTDHYIFASSTTGNPPSGGPLQLTLPAIGSTDLGLSYRIVVSFLGAPSSPPNPATDGEVTLTYDSGDEIHDARGGVIASGGAPYILSAKSYDLICTDGTIWTLIQLD